MKEKKIKMENWINILNEYKGFEPYNGYRSPGIIDVGLKKYITRIYFDGQWFDKVYDISDFISGKTEYEIRCGISDYIKSVDEEDGK